MAQTVETGVVKTIEIKVTTTGGAGVSTGTTTSPQIVGQILDIAVDWHASAPGATSDVTIEGATTGIDLYAKSDAATPVKKAIGAFPVDPASASGAALSGALIDRPMCIAEPIKVTVAQCDDLTDAVIVRVTYRTVRVEKVVVTTTGSAGSASGNATTNPITGEIVGILLDYGAVPAGTNDVLVTGATTGRQLYAKTNTATDVFVVPCSFCVDSGGSAIASDITPRNICVGEAVKFALAQSDALATALTGYVFYIPCEAETIAVTTTGSAGSASGSGKSLKNKGELLGIYLDFHASAPGTTDITIAETGQDANHTPASIYAKANSVTDVYIIPGRLAVSNADAALTNDVTPRNYYFGKPLNVSIAQADALTDCVKATIFTRIGS